MNKIFKRFYHPGFGDFKYKKLCVPYCPKNNQSKYYKHVWGNKIQEIQLQENIFSYDTNEINYYSKKLNNLFDNDIVYLPSSHNTPIDTAIRSCRNIQSDKIISDIEKLDILDENNIFVNTLENQNKLLKIINKTNNKQERTIIESALYGIFSNYGDSIYIANDYLQVSEKHVVISNYPSKVSQREIERCKIVAYCLLLGNFPIILDKEIEFEGEANIKFLPALINENNIDYQVCLSYDSSRSNLKCIDNINNYMEKLNLPLLKDINIKPKKNLKEYFYHLDCILNFSVDPKIQYFKSEQDFLNNYKKNGVVVYEKNGLDNKYLKILNSLFSQLIPVNKDEDLLCANMIVTPGQIVGSSNIKNEINNFYSYVHPSSGGGGAHKCCSNIININSSISLSEWICFNKELGIEVNNSFIKGVHSEMDRIKKNHNFNKKLIK